MGIWKEEKFRDSNLYQASLTLNRRFKRERKRNLKVSDSSPSNVILVQVYPREYRSLKTVPKSPTWSCPLTSNYESCGILFVLEITTCAVLFLAYSLGFRYTSLIYKIHNLVLERIWKIIQASHLILQIWKMRWSVSCSLCYSKRSSTVLKSSSLDSQVRHLSSQKSASSGTKK